MKKYYIASIVVALAIIGGYFFPRANSILGVSTSPTTVFNTARVAETGLIPSIASATTTTSLLNTDSTDRIITDAFAFCSGLGTSNSFLVGAGIANLTFAMGTSSNLANSLPNVSSYLLTIATSTGNAYTASSTLPAVAGVGGLVWASGTYWVINANATNTASCIAGVHYLAS